MIVLKLSRSRASMFKMQRLNAEEKLERDLEETSAVESKQKKSKIVTKTLRRTLCCVTLSISHSKQRCSRWCSSLTSEF